MIGRNNPLNIRWMRHQVWIGQSGHTKGFVDFDSVFFCFRAAVILINRYRSYDKKTIRQIISRWAPSAENDTENYINFVCGKTGLADSCVIDDYDSYFLLLSSMCIMECGAFPVNYVDELSHAIKKYIVNL